MTSWGPVQQVDCSAERVLVLEDQTADDSPVSVDVGVVEEGVGVLVPGVDVDDGVGGVGGVAGVALDVVRQPMEGSSLSQEVVELAGQVLVPRHDGLDKLGEGGDRLSVHVGVVLKVVVVLQQVLVELLVVPQTVFSAEDESVSREKSLVRVSHLNRLQVILDLVNVLKFRLRDRVVGEAVHEVPPCLTAGLVGDTDADLVISVDPEHINLRRLEEVGVGVLVLWEWELRLLYLLLESLTRLKYILHCLTCD